MQQPEKRRGQFESRVIENAAVCRDHFRLTIEIDSFPSTMPGQFVQLLCRGEKTNRVNHEIDWNSPERPQGDDMLDRLAFLRRPFSIAQRHDSGPLTRLQLIGRTVGPATRYLAELKAGETLNVIGPLGNQFQSPREANARAILVGGGVGIPPMMYLAQQYARSDFERVAICGALSRDLLPLQIEARENPSAQEFSRHGCRSVLCTDDGSLGYRGFVTGALELELGAMTPAQKLVSVIYTCGPEAMMKAVQAMAARHEVACQIAVERAMACGMGTCQSCVIRVRRQGEARFALACTEGPVFDGVDLLW